MSQRNGLNQAMPCSAGPVSSMKMSEPRENVRPVSVEFDWVNSRVLTSFPELVTGLGGDPDALLRQVGISPRGPINDHLGLRYLQMVELVGLAAEELQCPDFGMRLARQQAKAIESPLREVVRNSPTLGEALKQVVSHSYAHSLAAAIWLTRVQADETVKFGHDILIEGSPDRRQVIEQILLLEYLICLAATGGSARARRVEFRHQPVSPPASYRAYFGCEARFGQPTDAIVYGEHVLACPIAAPDPIECRRTLAEIDDAFVERKAPLRATVRGAVIRLIASDRCTNLDVSSALGLHARTLHRNLRREGTSFQRIKNQVRRDLLIHYLDHSDLSVGEISERLGFAEQSAMTRFCRQSLAVSPTERRTQARWLQTLRVSKMGKSHLANCTKT